MFKYTPIVLFTFAMNHTNHPLGYTRNSIIFAYGIFDWLRIFPFDVELLPPDGTAAVTHSVRLGSIQYNISLVAYGAIGFSLHGLHFVTRVSFPFRNDIEYILVNFVWVHPHDFYDAATTEPVLDETIWNEGGSRDRCIARLFKKTFPEH